MTLPVMLFLEIAQMDAGALLDLKFLGFGFFSSLACILLIWAGARLFLKDKSMVGSFVQGSLPGKCGASWRSAHAEYIRQCRLCACDDLIRRPAL